MAKLFDDSKFDVVGWLYAREEAAITRQYDPTMKQFLTLRAKFPIPAEETTNNERPTTNAPIAFYQTNPPIP